MKTQVHNIFSETGCLRQDALTRYRGNKMSALEKHDVERHLIDCELCSDALEGLALVTSASVIDEVRKSVSEQTYDRKSAVSYPTGRLLLVAASISIVALLSYFTWQQYDKVVAPTNILTQNEVNNNEVPTQKILPISVAADSNTNQREVHTELIKVDRTNDAISESKPAAPETKVETADIQVADDDEIFEFNKEAELMEVEVEDNNQAAIEEADIAITKSQGGTTTTSNMLFSPSSAQGNVSYLNNHKVFIKPPPNKLKKNSSIRSKSISPKYENKDALSVAEDPSIKREELTYEKALELALIDFGNNNYDDALKKLKTIENVHPKDKNVEFYSGMSNYNLSNYSEALSSLETLSNDDAGVFNEEAEYYTALSYYKSGNTKKGTKMLENISKNDGFYSEDAQSYKKKIKQIINCLKT